jgi:hypothetical protein
MYLKVISIFTFVLLLQGCLTSSGNGSSGEDSSTEGTLNIRMTWSKVTQDIEDKDINNVAGYKIYIGKSTASYDLKVDIEGSENTSYEATRLVPGTYYLSMTSYLTSGLESELSEETQITL